MILLNQIEKIYNKQVLTRFKDYGTVYYFSEKDFPGMKKIPFAFRGNTGQKLQGYFYSYDKPIANKLIIFDHGMGGGHRSYFREIETLAKKGYLVFSYDHTGCMESEGENTRGFAQSLNDLDCCVKALKKVDFLKGFDISVIGHSWGGFSSMNIPALHPEISHVVAMSGFVNVSEMLKQIFFGVKKLYEHFYAIEEKNNPVFSKTDTVKSLKNTNTKVLIIHSADDKTVNKRKHFDVMQKGLASNPNVEFMLLHGKNHNPNFTEFAVVYKDDFFKDLSAKLKKKELVTDEQKKKFVASYDWWKMTAQDEKVWEKIFEFLES